MPPPLHGSSEEIWGLKYYSLKITREDHILLHIREIHKFELLKEEATCTNFIKGIFASVFIKQQLSDFLPFVSYKFVFVFFSINLVHALFS